MELDYQAIGVRIRRLRKERGLAQQTLADCSLLELKVITETIRTLKENLRRVKRSE